MGVILSIQEEPFDQRHIHSKSNSWMIDLHQAVEAACRPIYKMYSLNQTSMVIWTFTCLASDVKEQQEKKKKHKIFDMELDLSFMREKKESL